MSCIIGIKSENGVWIGGDSAITKGDKITTGWRKVFRLDNVLLGMIGYVRIHNIIQHEFYPPAQAEGTSDEEYFVRLFIPVLVELFESRGVMEGGIFKEEFKKAAPEFIIGYKDNLYHLDYDMTIVNGGDFYSIGIGEDFAEGFYHNCPPTMNPRQIISSILNLVFKNYNGVRPPFMIEKL